MYKPFICQVGDKESYKEALVKCLENVYEHIDDSILNDWENHIVNIDIHIKVGIGEIAVYNVQKEYNADYNVKEDSIWKTD